MPAHLVQPRQRLDVAAVGQEAFFEGHVRNHLVPMPSLAGATLCHGREHIMTVCPTRPPTVAGRL